jgi:hypothetical protein
VMERDDALLRLTRTYFTTRGPATSRDFAWWSGLTMADARRGIELAGTSLESETVEGQRYWVGSSVPATGRSSPGAHLLPNFDEYSVGFRDRSAITHRLKKLGLEAPTAAVLGNVIVVDGQMVGFWKRTLNRDAVAVELNLLLRVTTTERKAVAAAAQRYGEFIELPVRIQA